MTTSRLPALTGAALVLALTGTLIAGCATGSDGESSATTAPSSAASTPSSESTPTAESPADSSDTVTADSIETALTALVKKIGGDPARVVTVHVIDASTVRVEAIDPAAPTELNEWTYRDGKVSDPVPINYGENTEALEQNLFDITEVDPQTMADLVANAPATAGIEDGEAGGVIIERLLLATGDDRVIAQVSVRGARSDRTLRATMDGNVFYNE